MIFFFKKGFLHWDRLEKGKAEFQRAECWDEKLFLWQLFKKFLLFPLLSVIGLAWFSSVGLLFFSVPLTTSQSWPVKGRADTEGAPKQEPSLLTCSKRSPCQVLKSRMLLQTQHGLELCPRCMPSSNFLMFQKNNPLIFPNALQNKDLMQPQRGKGWRIGLGKKMSIQTQIPFPGKAAPCWRPYLLDFMYVLIKKALLELQLFLIQFEGYTSPRSQFLLFWTWSVAKYTQ